MSNKKYSQARIKISSICVLYEILKIINFFVKYDKHNSKLWRKQDTRLVKRITNVVIGNKVEADKLLYSLLFNFYRDEVVEIVKILKIDKTE